MEAEFIEDAPVIPKLATLLSIERGKVRFRCSFGGRGSGKSQSFAKAAAVFGYNDKLKILCTREFQSSIKDSFYAEVKAAIESNPYLNAHYDVGVNFIKGKNGTDFIFAGLRNNISSIKSMAKIDICIVEEAETIPEYAWRDLIPTIRAPKSEIWVIWNPCQKCSPVDMRFRNAPDSDIVTVEVNYSDNPYFPDTLEVERQRDQRNLDDSVYRHIWEGAYLEISESQVFKGKYRIAEFTPMDYWNGAYWGSDWGFANDATTLVKSWIHDETIYIEHECYAVGVEIDELSQLFDTIKGSRDHVIYADSARPETISYMRRQGFNIRAAKKGAGSIEEGVQHLKSFKEIIIHPRCTHTAEEFRLYSYKTDRLSGDILPIIVDANNHILDALRYSQEPIMKRGVSSLRIESTENNNITSW